MRWPIPHHGIGHLTYALVLLDVPGNVLHRIEMIAPFVIVCCTFFFQPLLEAKVVMPILDRRVRVALIGRHHMNHASTSCLQTGRVSVPP